MSHHYEKVKTKKSESELTEFQNKKNYNNDIYLSIYQKNHQ